MLWLCFLSLLALKTAGDPFLDHDAYYLITQEEKKVYLKLTEAYQKRLFIEAFWKRRDPFPETPRNEFQEAYLSRLKEAEDLWGFKDDRTRWYALFGEPYERFAIHCSDLYYPGEVWHFRYIEVIHRGAWVLFYQKYGMGPWRVWEGDTLNGFYVPEGSSSSELCFEAIYARRAMNWTMDALQNGDMALLLAPPPVDLEDLEDILTQTTYMEKRENSLSASLEVAFLPTPSPKTAVKITLLMAEEGIEGVDCIGEILREEQRADYFHRQYRFPKEEKKLPTLPIQRYLFPGTYQLRIKLTALDSKKRTLIVQPLTVPALEQEKGIIPPFPEILTGAFHLQSPLKKDGITGFQRFSVPALEGIDRVVFYLDGNPILQRNTPPYEVELNLGALPLPHVLRAEGFDEEGNRVAWDALYLNQGKNQVAVHFVSPHPEEKIKKETFCKLVVITPEKDPPKTVDLFINDEKVLTLFNPPWEATLSVPQTGTPLLRARLTTTKGQQAEDILLLKAGGFGEMIQVKEVNLPVTILDKHHHPLEKVKPEDVQVFENGVPQTVSRVTLAKEKPLFVGILLDSSKSMEDAIEGVKEAVTLFIETLIRKKDRYFIVDFDQTSRLVCPFSGNLELLESCLAGITADGGTALWDALVFSLYHMDAPEPRRALILLSDGKDTQSRFSYEQLKTFLQRAGVPIYAIAYRLKLTDLAVRSRLKELADLSGGELMIAQSPEELKKVYQKIQDRLRTQYIITYVSNLTGREFRQLKVQVKGADKVHTLAGYYP